MKILDAGIILFGVMKKYPFQITFIQFQLLSVIWTILFNKDILSKQNITYLLHFYSSYYLKIYFYKGHFKEMKSISCRA